MQFTEPQLSDESSAEPTQLVDLVISRGATQHRLRPIRKRMFVVGRADDCDLVLGDPQFADYHAYILLRDNRISFRQLGAGPDVTVNQRLMRWGDLHHGDRIRTGPYEFRLRVRPVFSQSNQVSRENLNALEKLPTIRLVRSTFPRLHSDTSDEPVSWFDDGASNHVPRLSSAWDTIPEIASRLSDWW